MAGDPGKSEKFPAAGFAKSGLPDVMVNDGENAEAMFEGELLSTIELLTMGPSPEKTSSAGFLSAVFP